MAVHGPARSCWISRLTVALGGDCLADVVMLRSEPGVFGPVASDPTVSRLLDALVAASLRALVAPHIALEALLDATLRCPRIQVSPAGKRRNRQG
jgi:hypothetical protein